MRPTPPASSSPSTVHWWRWLFPMALAATVILASGRNQVAAPSVIGFDKLAHFSVFGLLATLIARCPGVHRFRYAIAIVSLFGISDEFRQSFTPGRSVEVADWIADTLGAGTAVTIYAFWPWYRRLLETPLRFRRATRAATTAPVLSTGETSETSSASAA